MKNREFKKILAVALMVAMVGSMTGTATIQTHAADTKQKTETTSITDEIDSKLSELLSSEADSKDKASKAKKTETVYSKIDETGSVKEVTVSDQLQNVKDEKTIKDKTNLTDIQNLKGDEKFDQSGDALTWSGDGKDIVYSGTAQASDLPVGLKITYTLDGKNVNPSDLEGQSGHLVVRYDYDNLSKSRTGEFVPFLMATGIVIDGDTFTNITTTNAKIASDGDRDLVIGYGFPGVAQELETDLDIPDYFEMEADVENYKAPQSITLATNEVFNEIDTDGIDSVDTLKDSMKQLSDASNQLVDGSGQLKDGLDTLLSSSGELVSGVDQLASGGKDLASGSNTLSSGLSSASTTVQKKLLPGAQQVDAGVSEMTNQVGAKLPEFSTGLQKLQASLTAANNGTTIKDGVNQLQGALTYTGKNLTIKDGTSALKYTLNTYVDGKTTVKDGIDGVVGGANDLNVAATNVAGVVNGLTSISTYADNTSSQEEIDLINNFLASNAAALNAASIDTSDLTNAVSGLQNDQTNRTAALETYRASMSQIQTANSVASNFATGTSTLLTGAKKLQNGIAQAGAGAAETDAGVDTAKAGAVVLNAGVDQALDGVNQLSEGVGQLSTKLGSGLSDLKDGTSQVANGVSTLSGGLGLLSAGASDLNTGAGTLSAGLTSLQSKTPALVSGITQLDNGAKDLNSGMIEFDETGVQKLTSAFNGDLDELFDKLNTMLDSSKKYNSFSGVSEKMDGNVKFVFVADSETK